jgi:hypothetical protein
MGLILLTSASGCAEPRPVEVERRFIPHGADVVLEQESDVFLGPNDWENGLYNNTGSARVEVEITRR